VTQAVRTDPIVHEVQIDARPETVFEFFTDPEKVTRWLAVAATLDPRPGGVCHQTHAGRNGDHYYMQGEFVEVDPPRRVVFTWGFTNPELAVEPGTSTVEVTLEERDGGTHVRLVHGDLPAAERGAHDGGWATMLARLERAVDETEKR
jgi:uncharacterized protein YndB with AHSA1/START domain